MTLSSQPIPEPSHKPPRSVAFTLIELKELQEFVKKGKKVLVALSPCGLCGKLKGDLLECILKHKIVSHVVVDARSAGQMLGMVAEGNGGLR